MTASEVKVAVVQTALPLGEVEANRRRFADLVRDLDVDLVVAGELFFTGYDLALVDEQGARLAEPLDGGTVALLQALAHAKGATFVVGLLEQVATGLSNTAVVVTPDGHVQPYRKVHLFPPERSRFIAGDEIPVFDTPVGRIAPQICFDHAFPAMATTQAAHGAQILVIPSAVGSGYHDLIEVRTRARAQDNQLFAIAANLNTPGFCGYSMVVGPHGQVLAQAASADAVLLTTLDLGLIDRERQQEVSLSSARPDLYDVGNLRTDNNPSPLGTKPCHNVAE